jgi:hypothetical protein
MEELVPNTPIPDIDDIAAPLAPPGNEWIFYALIAASILSVALIVFILTRRRKPSHGQDYDARRSAMDQLHQLKEEYTRVPANECALRVSHALREYLFAFHNPSAPYETSGELLRTLAASGHPLLPERLESLRALLEDCDLMQYARAGDADSRRLATVETAIAFIRNDSTRRATITQENAKPEPHHADPPAA